MPILLTLAGVAVACLVCGVVLLTSYRRVGPGEALLIERGGGPTRVRFGSGLVLPMVQRGEVLDLSVRKVVVERRGKQGLSCRDGIRVDVRGTFLVKVEQKEEAVLRVAREVGCARANRQEEVQALLEERFACALANAASTFNFDELLADRSLFIDHVMMEVGDELLGFRLERMSLGRLEQTPLDQLDPTNVVDAQGILKLTERATRLALETSGQMRQQQKLEQRGMGQAPWEAPRREGELGEAELEREVERALAERARNN
ncbi:SPFH domain-containing protein [Archangium lansingense]|uniref:SPFH domain-containing protein n=1 Tax=Archangium lansingense TaxID=2995310 RepID=A0ABT4AN05_9BACT|nr:SPFH domain-containing protein [Archangium lansinium]MCY1083035.1 SPFH domain-containing protein [Archangium lansinium]